MVEPVISSIIALKAVLGHAAWSKLVLIYKGLIVSSHGGTISSVVPAAVHAAQTIGVAGALQMVAQMLIIIGTAEVGSAAYAGARQSLKRMAEGNHEKALKHARKALKAAKPALKVWTPGPAGW